MKRLWLPLAILVLAGFALPAYAVVTPLSQERSVQTFALYDPAQGDPETSNERIDFSELGEWTEVRGVERPR